MKEGVPTIEEIDGEWKAVRNKIIPGQLVEAANLFYDAAQELVSSGWDGSTQLEKDGKINQHLDD